MAEIHDDAGKEAGFSRAQEEANNVKLHGRFNEAHGCRQQTPGDHDPRNPLSRTPMFHNQAAGNLEQEIADEEYTGAETVDLRREAQIFAHFAGGVANVNTVEKSNAVDENNV